MDVCTSSDVSICINWMFALGNDMENWMLVLGIIVWTLAHQWTIVQGESAGIGRLYYFQFTVNLVSSFVLITLP